MAASTGAVKNFLQVQKPLSLLWRQRGAAVVNCAVVRLQSNKSGSSGAGPSKSPPPAKETSTTPTPVTDGNSYEVPEYYGYNEMSFYDEESAMHKYRLTQPDSRKPLQPAAK